MTPAPATASKTSSTHRTSAKPSMSRRLPPVSPLGAETPRGPEPILNLARPTSWIDYPVALLLLIVTGPITLMAMALVKLTSHGPAIYRQSRVGQGGVVFTIYKIRTMTDDCESLTGPRWSMPGDPRITPLGHVLRLLHIDELPQLVNVLKGDMALIGPRPERPEICEELRSSIPHYDRRHAVKPGITGYAQIHLPPDTSIRSVKQKLIYDRFYIRHMSFGLDLYILVCTALKVLHLRCLYRHTRPVSA